MFRCSFCKDIAAFECSENRFCSKHRSEHEITHKGSHNLKDVFCMLSKQAEVEFKQEISRRIKTLKECKNAFSAATAEYIKNIHNMLFQKLNEIDKMSESYIKLTMKEYFERSDAEIIDNIFATRLSVKPLENFTDSKFTEYLQQEIIESKKSASKILDMGESLNILSNEAKLLVDIITCCVPKNIPEKMLREVLANRIGETFWIKAKEELVNSRIVYINEEAKLWSIFQDYINEIEKREILVSVNKDCLSFCTKSLKFDENIEKNSKAASEIRVILVHAEKIIENNKIENNNEVEALLNAGRAYLFLESNQIKAKKYLKNIIEKLNLSEGPRIFVHECINVTGNLCTRLQYYNEEVENFFLKCLQIEEQASLENNDSLATLYINIGNFFLRKANCDMAEKFLLKCLRIQDQILSELHPHKATLYQGLGILYGEKRVFDEAERFYLQCLMIQDKTLPDNHPDKANVYKLLGEVYMNKEEFDKTEKCYLQCLRIFLQILPENHIKKADIYFRLGGLYKRKEEYDKAEKFYLQSLKIHNEIMPVNYSGQADLYFDMGNLYIFKAEYDKAKSYFIKCQMVQEQYLPENHLNRNIVNKELSNLI